MKTPPVIVFFKKILFRLVILACLISCIMVGLGLIGIRIRMFY